MMRRDPSRLDGAEFDLLVCGGGIYGAWTAYDAALRGLRVALLDQGDWAGGTSSASSKLIHGGLRYLETFDFKLVRKALREREMLLEAAPHRVWPLRFGLPIDPDSRVGPLRLKAGLSLYDLLAGTFGTEKGHRRYGRRDFAARFPCLDDTLFTGGYTYRDAQTDDARFVLEIVDGALGAGAVCVNYCKVLRYVEAGGRIRAAVVRDQCCAGRSEMTVRFAQAVNATGQWTDGFHPGERPFRLSKGVHLVLPGVLGEEALLLMAKSDGRVFFMIPWYGFTLLGTTDSDYAGPVDRIAVEPDEVAYLLEEANRVLAGQRWREDDIVGAFAGLRVLQRSDKASPSAVSREWQMATAGNGLIHSIGGKFTSARDDAASLVDSVCKSMGVKAGCTTESRPFPWAPPGDYGAWRNACLARACRLGVDEESARWLLRRHGSRTEAVLRLVEDHPSLAARLRADVPFVVADLLFCAGNEMVVHLEDLLRRRMPLLILARLNRGELERIAALVAGVLGWDENTVAREADACSRRWLP